MNDILINMQITGRYTIHSYINKAHKYAVLGELKDQLLTNLRFYRHQTLASGLKQGLQLTN